MRTSAKRHKDGGQQDQWDAYLKLRANPELWRKACLQYKETHPTSTAGIFRGHFDYATFGQVEFQSKEKINDSVELPMTEHQWLTFAVGIEGGRVYIEWAGG
jgi:hypothetical protein